MVQVVLLLAVLKVLGGLAGAFFAEALPRPFPDAGIPLDAHLIGILVFGVTGGWWIVAGRDDRRARYLGLALLLIGAAFSEGPARALLAGGSPSASLSMPAALSVLKIEALLPFSVWLFACEFPRTAWFSRSVRVAAEMTGLSFAVGVVLIVANLPLAFRPESWGALDTLGRSSSGIFWGLVLLLTLPVVPFLVWRAGQADREERQRVRIFVTALALGIGPLFLHVVLEALSPRFARLMERPPFWIGTLVVYLLVLSTPFTTAYAVLVPRVLALRQIFRRTLRYVLARTVYLALLVVPLLEAANYLSRRRLEPLEGHLSGGSGVVLLSVAALALIVVRLRTPLLEAIDRRYFREQYDARQILAELVRESRMAASPEGLSDLLEREIDRALNLESIIVLNRDREIGVFVASGGRTRPLPIHSALAAIATARSEPLEIDLEASDSTLASLSESDCEWLADGGFQLIVPLRASDGGALGLIALGEKRSELPFSAGDRSLLTDIAASGSRALETLLLLDSSGLRDPEAGDAGDVAALGGTGEALAHECTGCRLVLPAGTSTCVTCRAALVPASVPYVVLGKFRLDQRLGAGGKGTVYRATDLASNRQVAIKTLPRVPPERSLRIRREARAMAAVAHPHLASIYGAETWRGTPMLIVELLEGGTLSRRLFNARLSYLEAIQLGVDLGHAVAALHSVGILHGDIKPSNIGFTHEGQVKLLDGGLSRMLGETGGHRDAPAFEAEMEIGAPLYMSPEATAGEATALGFDLWSLAVVLYEALAGANPFSGGDLEETRRRIRAVELPRLNELRQDCPPRVSDFFVGALHPRASFRPASARDLIQQLRQLESSLQIAA